MGPTKKRHLLAFNVHSCPECGDDASFDFPSAAPGAPDYGECTCSSCGHAFIVDEPTPEALTLADRLDRLARTESDTLTWVQGSIRSSKPHIAFDAADELRSGADPDKVLAKVRAEQMSLAAAKAQSLDPVDEAVEFLTSEAPDGPDAITAPIDTTGTDPRHSPTAGSTFTIGGPNPDGTYTVHVTRWAQCHCVWDDDNFCAVLDPVTVTLTWTDDDSWHQAATEAS